MRRFFLIAGALLLLIPLSNWLLFDKPIEVNPIAMEGKTPLFKKAAPIIQESCLNCHSSQTQLPWYASLPGAKQMILRDIRRARKDVDLSAVLFTRGQAPAGKVLDRIESEVEDGEMPPLQYSLFHWSSFLSAQEKQALLDWIHEQRQIASEPD